MRHVINALVQNQPGVLAGIAGMLASRGFNLISLAVAETQDPDRSRMTFVLDAPDSGVDQARLQIDKLVPVIEVEDISSESRIERDLMLVKLECPSEHRIKILAEIDLIVRLHHARVVHISAEHNSVIVEYSGTEDDVEEFMGLLRSFKIIELRRTGRIAMVRGGSPNAQTAEARL